jgi:hypothetical protein
MRLLDTASRTMVMAFLRRAEYEIAFAHPQPAIRIAQTGPAGYWKWRWPAHDLEIAVLLSSPERAEVRHPSLSSGLMRARPDALSYGAVLLFYCMFDLLGNDDQAFRVLHEPYKGP